MPSPLSRPQSLLLLLLLLVTTALYARGLWGPFIFDDGPALTGNSYLKIDGSEFDAWRTASLSTDSGPLHRPIAMWSFTANVVAAGGVRPFPLKLTNLLVHLACGVLVFLFARGVLCRGMREAGDDRVNWTALFAAALWLLAPLHVSTVLYTVQRMAQLATLFALAGLVLFTHRRERWARSGATAGEVLATSLWLLLFALLAALSKENGLLLLWLLPVLEVTLFRGQWGGHENRVLRGLGWAALLAPLLLVGGLLWWAPQNLLGGYSWREFTLQERLLTQLRLLWQYVGWMAFPDINSMGFQHDDLLLSRGWLHPVTTLLAGTAWLTVLLAALLLHRRVPLLLFALLFYLVGHFMESGIWPLEMVYEHRNYLPSVGVYILLAAALSALFQRIPALRPRVPAFAVLATCATLLFLRVFTWSDAIRLSAVNVEHHPHSSRSHFFLAESWLHAYRRALDAGASNEELGDYLVLARNQFELMYRDNPRDMAAIVMLYYLDQHHFQGLQKYNDWFAKLEKVARDRPLQASDYTSLDALLDCFVAEVCGASRERLFGLLDTLERRYPHNSRLALLRYRYLKAIDAPLAERMALLRAVQARRPWDDRVYQYLLVEEAESRDIAGLYETLGAWLAHDPGRRKLTVIRHLFSAPASGAAPTSTSRVDER